MHDNYSEVTFNNDIAVIILNTSVQIGKFVSSFDHVIVLLGYFAPLIYLFVFQARPLCIPRTNIQLTLPQRGLSDKTNFQERGVVAGWGVTG